MITEQDKLNMLGFVSNACDLYQVFDTLVGSVPEVQFTLECSVCDGAWRVLVVRQGKEDVEGSGWTIEQAIIDTLPYLDE